MLASLAVAAAQSGAVASAQAGAAMPVPPRLVAPVVPADGVVGFWLPIPELADAVAGGDVPLRVASATGNDIAGTVSRFVGSYVVFSSDEPLISGETFTLQLDFDGSWVMPEFPFLAVDALGAAPAFPEAVVETDWVDLGVEEEHCCQATCFVTYRRSGVIALLTAHVEAAPSVRGQFVYGFALP